MIRAESAISFPSGTTARAVRVAANVDGEEVLRRLGLPQPRATLVVNGSTTELSGELKDRLGIVIGDGVADVALADGLTVLTGATDAGIFSMLGAAMNGLSAPLVGVAPHRLVTWPGRRPRLLRWLDRNREDLEPNHSHFVLVDGAKWGDETQPLLGLAAALGARAPSGVVLCGGGAVARQEAIGHSRASRPLVVLAESGRLADDLATAVEAGDADDPLLAEIVKRGNVTVCPLRAGPAVVATAIRNALR